MVHRSWPLRISFDGEGAQVRFSVGNATTDPHLTLDGDLLGISAPVFLQDLAVSVSGGFADWIRKSDDPAVLERGQPSLLIVSKDDDEAKRECVRFSVGIVFRSPLANNGIQPLAGAPQHGARGEKPERARRG